MSSDSATPTRYVPLADVARPHGVRGECRLRLYNKDSDLLLTCKQVRLTLPDGKTTRDMVIQKARPALDVILVTFKGVGDRDAALTIQGSKVSVPREAFPPLEDGEFYVCDIVGAPASIEVSTGEPGAKEPLGEVVDFRSYPTVDVLVVKTKAGVYEVPLTDAYVADVSAEGVVVRKLDGLEPD